MQNKQTTTTTTKIAFNEQKLKIKTHCVHEKKLNKFSIYKRKIIKILVENKQKKNWIFIELVLN